MNGVNMYDPKDYEMEDKPVSPVKEVPDPAGGVLIGKDTITRSDSAPRVMCVPYGNTAPNRKHGHYYRSVESLAIIDFYRLVELYDINDGAVQHILKKCMAAGKRGSKDFRRDLEDMRDTAQRRIDMLTEDETSEHTESDQ